MNFSNFDIQIRSFDHQIMLHHVKKNPLQLIGKPVDGFPMYKRFNSIFRLGISLKGSAPFSPFQASMLAGNQLGNRCGGITLGTS